MTVRDILAVMGSFVDISNNGKFLFPVNRVSESVRELSSCVIVSPSGTLAVL